MDELHARIARALGWEIVQVHSMSLLALREMVRPISPKLVHEITLASSQIHLPDNEQPCEGGAAA